jgi:uncharacterized oxidoreductase
LRGLVHAMIRAGGSAEDEAAMVTDHLLESNLQGHDSHGIMLLVRYVENLRAGKLHAGAMPEAVRQEASLAVFDGKMGYGQRIGRITMDWAINAARQHGHAVMALRNVHHLGRIGSYGEQAARWRPLAGPMGACPPIRFAWPCRRWRRANTR